MERKQSGANFRRKSILEFMKGKVKMKKVNDEEQSMRNMENDKMNFLVSI